MKFSEICEICEIEIWWNLWNLWNLWNFEKFWEIWEILIDFEKFVKFVKFEKFVKFGEILRNLWNLWNFGNLFQNCEVMLGMNIFHVLRGASAGKFAPMKGERLQMPQAPRLAGELRPEMNSIWWFSGEWRPKYYEISWFLLEFGAVRINLWWMFIFCALSVDGNDLILRNGIFQRCRLGCVLENKCSKNQYRCIFAPNQWHLVVLWVVRSDVWRFVLCELTVTI